MPQRNMKYEKIGSILWFKLGTPDQLVDTLASNPWMRVGEKKDDYYLLCKNGDIITLCEVLVDNGKEVYRYATIQLGWFTALMRHLKFTLSREEAVISLEQIFDYLLNSDWMARQYLLDITVEKTQDKLVILKLMGEDWASPDEIAAQSSVA